MSHGFAPLSNCDFNSIKKWAFKKILRMLRMYIAFALLNSQILFAAAGYGSNCDSLSYRIGVRVRCDHPTTGESINCRRDKVPIGTVARYKCEDFYVTLDGDGVGGNMTCNEKGKWTPEHPFRAFSCNIDCGRQLGDNKWPWHAAIFQRQHSSGPFKFMCGGTLINPSNQGILILTAARCFGSGLTLRDSMDPTNVKVALGLVTGDFIQNQESHEVDIFGVRSIVSNSVGGIALLKLSKEVTLKENILPVCFNANHDLANEQLKEGAIGEFVGFGEKFHSGEFDVLRGVGLPLLPSLRCRRHPDETRDICAGYHDGKNICRGDNGGALLFNSFSGHSKRNFVQGIYKHYIPESREHVCESSGEFARLVDYASWIRDTAAGFYLEEEFDIAFQRETPAPASPTKIPSLLRPIQTEQPGVEYPHTGADRYKTQKPGILTTTGRYPPPPPYHPPDIPISPPKTGSTINYNPRDYELAALEWHNIYRGRHGSPPLVLNAQLNREAQREAEESLRVKKFYSTSGISNWFSLTGAGLRPADATKEAVKDWYKSYALYDKNKPESSPFTTLIWKSGTDIGVGYAGSGQDQVVVVKYKWTITRVFPNTKAAFLENVLPRLNGE